jgi:hypothetical protein
MEEATPNEADVASLLADADGLPQAMEAGKTTQPPTTKVLTRRSNRPLSRPKPSVR